MNARLIAGMAVVLMLNGCMVPNTPGVETGAIDVPDQWQARPVGEAGTANDWLAGLNIPGLPALVNEALENNNDLAIAAARLSAAGRQAAIDGADRYPAVTATSGAQRERNNGGGDRFYSRNLNLDLGVSWEADLWGRISATQSAAQADLHAARNDYRAARLSLAAQTSDALITLVATRLQREIDAERVDSFEKTLALVQRRYERGLVSALDVRLAATDAASANTLLAQREDETMRAARAVEILLGRYPAGTIQVSNELPSLSEPVPAGLPSELLTRRPDLVAEHDRLIASSYRTDVARADLLPSFKLTASGGTQTSTLRNLLDVNFLVSSLVANVTQPLFQSGRLRNAVRLREDQVDEQLATWARTLLVAFGEVESALGAEQWLAQQDRAIQDTVEQALAAERIAESRYERGVTRILELLEARRRSLDERGRLVEIRRSRLSNRIALHLALGGDFEGARS